MKYRLTGSIDPSASQMSLRHSGSAGCRRQGGQALVFSLFTASLVILALFAMYSMGSRVIEKIRLQNTADSAAYSSAVAEARDYNFSAYTNRAMVANQVAVAQFVGLTSWMRNMSSFAKNNTGNAGRTIYELLLDWGGSPLSSIYRKFLKLFGNATGLFDQGKPGSTFMTAMVTTMDALIKVYGISQQIFHYSTALSVAQTLGVVQKIGAVLGGAFGQGFTNDVNAAASFLNGGQKDIIAANDANAQLSVASLAYLAYHYYKWFKFTELKDPNTSNADGPNADRFAQVTMDSLDDFSRDRSTKPAWGFTFFYAPPLTYIDPTRFIPYQNGPLFLPVIHRGGTELKLTNASGTSTGATTNTAPNNGTGTNCNGGTSQMTSNANAAISVKYFNQLPAKPSPDCAGASGSVTVGDATHPKGVYAWNGTAWIDPNNLGKPPNPTPASPANGNRGAPGSMSKKTWTALDASSWAGLDISWISILGIPIPLPIPFAPPFIPLSSGAAQSGKHLDKPTVLAANNNFGDDAPAAYGSALNDWTTKISAGIRQKKTDPAGKSLDKFGLGGLTKYMDVTTATPNDHSSDNGPPLVVEVEKSVTDMPQSKGVGQYALPNDTNVTKMRSLSKAEVYFSRPQDSSISWFKRSDSKAELGSLYNPYWQPRLMSNNFLERYVSMELQLNGF